MAKDPAFNFYPAEASEDTQFMNRLERGAYFDIMKCQRLFHGITMVQMRKILGKDFEEVWPALELVLKQDEDGYYIEWVRESIEKRRGFQAKQKEKVEKRWEKYRGITPVIPLGNGNRNINNNDLKEKEDCKEKKQVNVPFESFWNEYDKKRGDKVKLEKKWSELTNEDRLFIMDYIPRYKAAQPNKLYRKDPSTFLNNKGWLDEIIPSYTSQSETKKFNGRVPEDPVERNMRMIKEGLKAIGQ